MAVQLDLSDVPPKLYNVVTQTAAELAEDGELHCSCGERATALVVVWSAKDGFWYIDIECEKHLITRLRHLKTLPGNPEHYIVRRAPVQVS